MQLTHQQYGDKLLIRAQGRLDASWSEFFADAMLNYVREGHHHLILDAGGMTFLSSAGIRALLRIHKEVTSVNGSLRIVQATEFVKNTLTTIGLNTWLTDEGLPEESAPADTAPDHPPKEDSHDQAAQNITFYTHGEGTGLRLSHPASWQPWQKVEHNNIARLRFSPDSFAIGIGSTTEHEGHDTKDFGEFLAVCGHVVYQPPDEKLRPDYLLSERNFSPELHAIQATLCQGTLIRLMRFAPGDNQSAYTVSDLIALMRRQADAHDIGFVILAECGGLVGATMIQSPAMLSASTHMEFPEIRNWLSFCGERAYAGQLTLMAGVATEPDRHKSSQEQADGTHVHAAIFPYQPIQNGHIAMADSVARILSGPPPLGLMHLIRDERPVTGLGESTLIRGACWFSAIKKEEVSL